MIEIWAGSERIEVAIIGQATREEVEKLMLHYYGKRRDAYMWITHDCVTNETFRGVW